MLRSATIDLSFPWVVSEGGYEWRVGKGSKALLCERNLRDVCWRVYQPLLEYPALFREFAELEGLDQIRKFADQHGVLFGNYSPADHVVGRGKYYSVGAAFGTTLNAWAQEIADISFLIDIWESIEAGRINKLRNLILWREGGAVEYQLVTPKRRNWKLLARAGAAHASKEGEVLNPARYVLQRELNDRLSNENASSGGRSDGVSYAPRLLRRADGTLHLIARPRNLLSAIWLQFAQVVGGSYELRRCPICHRHFLPKRTDAITCTDVCRQKKSRNARCS
jgi:hypothetical protein